MSCQKISLLVGLILLVLQPQLSFSQRQIDPEIQKSIDDYVEQVFLPQAGVSGLGLAVVQNDDEVLYTTGYGMANRGQDLLNRNMTQFFIGSVTKSFTSVLAVKLLHKAFPELGEAALDTPIGTLMPSLPTNFTLSDRFRSEHVTFRDLLSHRVCYARDDIQLYADPFESTWDVLRRQRYNHEVCQVRTRFEYNNMMFAIAGLLAAQLDNKSYEDAMQELFDELGMTSTFLPKRSDDFRQRPNLALPYYIRDNVAYLYNEELLKSEEVYNGAGGVAITPDDMVRYMRFHLNLGNLDGVQIIPEEVMKWVRKPSNIYTGLNYKMNEGDRVLNEFGYGLGLVLASYDGWEYIQHAGNIPPYISQLSLFPGKKLAICSVTHEGPSIADQRILHAFIFETLRGNEKTHEVASKLKKVLQEEKDEVTKNSFEDWKEVRKGLMQDPPDISGLWGSGNLGDMNITSRFNDDKNQTEYFIDYGRWIKGWLEDDGSGNVFRINFVTDFLHFNYAGGLWENNHFIGIMEDESIIAFSVMGPERVDVHGSFRKNGDLDNLPVIPWDPQSCGPEIDNS